MSAARLIAFKQVDVFTRVPFRGNPVAVVLDGRGLAPEDMQRIAGWTNLSETTFVLPPSSPDADYRLRIFTPRQELPFAGHPTIGSAHAVIEAGLAKPKNGKLRQECGAGVLEIAVERELLWLKAPRADANTLSNEDSDRIEIVLGAKVAALPIRLDVGPIWIVADLGDSETVAALAPDMALLAEFTERKRATGVTVFGKASDGRSALHVRSFAPAQGIPEDPVCGSGNISVAGYLLNFGSLAKYGAQYQARQGMQVGRDGLVSIRVEGEQIYLGGSAVTCVEGTLRV